MQEREEVEWAVWYHDAIYDACAEDNEVASARLARERLSAIGFPAPKVQQM